jgi:hypothetical protein
MEGVFGVWHDTNTCDYKFTTSSLYPGGH